MFYKHKDQSFFLDKYSGKSTVWRAQLVIIRRGYCKSVVTVLLCGHLGFDSDFVSDIEVIDNVGGNGGGW